MKIRNAWLAALLAVMIIPWSPGLHAAKASISSSLSLQVFSSEEKVFSALCGG